ncbi:MAG TPA: patatin-like phospholipase family protein [Dehalococcoidia bacterium]
MTRRALVLSGGGPVGIAWEAGILAGLAEEGVDLAAADFILGTSAGSVVGAQLALGRPPAAMLAAELAQVEGTRAAASTLLRPPDLQPLMEVMIKAATSGRSPEETRAEIGAFALAAETVPEEEFIATFGQWIGGLEGGWPERFACTAVDTADGTFVVWNREAGVSLARAVASSCAVPGIFPPVTINGRRYMDGGMRSGTNADLARGYDVVIVVSVMPREPVPGREAMAEAARRRLEGELASLRESGSVVALVAPDKGSQEAFGPNLMDVGRRAAAAEAGARQGRAEAGRLRDLWG